MAKKELANVTTDLSALASMMPTQRPGVAPLVAIEPPPLKVVAAPATAKAKEEPIRQFFAQFAEKIAKAA